MVISLQDSLTKIINWYYTKINRHLIVYIDDNITNFRFFNDVVDNIVNDKNIFIKVQEKFILNVRSNTSIRFVNNLELLLGLNRDHYILILRGFLPRHIKGRFRLMEEQIEVETKEILCKLCQKNMTIYTGTELCNSCWELKRRVEMYPDLAQKILDGIE